MRIYVLYLDVYFLENVLLNLVLLIFTLILTGRRIRFIRLLSASLIGGMMAILPIILRLRYGIAYILLILLTGLLVVTIASGIRSMSEQWTAMMYFYVMSFVWNRLFTGLERILGTKYTLCAAIVTAIMGTVSGYLYERKQIVKKQTIYDVEVAQQGRKLTLKRIERADQWQTCIYYRKGCLRHFVPSDDTGTIQSDSISQHRKRTWDIAGDGGR